MGDQDVSSEYDDQQALEFMKSLLADLSALERMIETGGIESGVRRIGAEQEMFLIDRSMRPASVATEVLEKVNDSRLTTEIGKFNLEANLSPQIFIDNCLRTMEKELRDVVELARKGANAFGADIVLTGILPTIRQSDLTLDNLSPNPRYAELNRALNHLRGNTYNIHIKGLDSLQLTHDNMMLEACCTSFQVHLQVSAQEFVGLYNWAQAITAPLLAAAANSPLLLGYRLWHETRIALFQHSVDERSNARYMRQHPARVTFGNQWLKDSVLELFREQIARFRVILTKKIEEDPLTLLDKGELPQLLALRLHNGTVWRWNRPCYGISDGQAHLRIENRVIPSGPTILDEMANASFFLGLMVALPEEYGDVSKSMSFDCAKENFFAAARHGLNAQFTWLKERRLSAPELILDRLLPLAHQGLKQVGVPTEDRDRYLGTIEERVRRDQNGSSWALRSLAIMKDQGTREQRHRALVASMVEQQKSDHPIHTWELAKLSGYRDWVNSFRTVGQFMTTDLFTLRPDDLIDLAASMMDWRHIRHIPVEDNEGHLIGLVSHRDLLKTLLKRTKDNNTIPIAVKDIMKLDPVTITSQTSTVEAIELMKSRRIGCLPVVEENQLVGIITAYDFLFISGELIKHVFSGSVEDETNLTQSMMIQT
jgi:CBS domain-containing protein/gamma-glutamyl:cysteine ligase YbdK (ATP-grasp superfamily)